MTHSITWCVSRLPVLKWLQIIVCFVLMLFLMDGRAQWHFYTFAYVTTVVLIVCTFLLLVALYFELPAANKSLPWLYIEMGFDLIACLLCLIVAAVFVYDFVLMTSGRFGHHKYMPPLNIGRDGWKNRIGVCAVFFALNTIFYFLSLFLTNREGVE
ncbi:hypothetical protein Tcan_05810 [Toxocara canis]|uniref:MARVEL domain-containing protein n=1 Tax=Toxocara canis TaxID=6265 RepID=A0A0B2URG5_TOXCA|nr:hypothetical protein Tcan_05810 [Toxocara canis]